VNVIVGAGVAAVRAAEALREAGSSEPIVMVGSERELPYERPPLSKELLRGEMTIQQAHLHDVSFYRDNAIELVLGTTAKRLDLADRALDLDDGRRLPFRQLLIATGSTPRRLGVPGEELENVLSLRTAADALRLVNLFAGACRVVVIGAGLVGLEVAAVARAAGKVVTVLETAPQPMARLLPCEEVASAIAELHRDHGTVVRTSVTVTELRGTNRVEEVILATGERLPADVVVVAIGVVPATEWLVGSGLHLDDGVVVDAELRTEVPGVRAAGDVARSLHQAYGRHLRLEQYGSAHEQGVVAGRAMAGVRGSAEVLPGAGSEQLGVRMHVVGLTCDADRVVVRGSVERRSFVAFFLRKGAIFGAFVMGRPREVPAVRKLVASRARLDE
jgi:3-phenylpropionate/trans-cinnamate dioxygenase ferredoxin reductase component